MIRENISVNFKGLPATGNIYTYDDAIERHQLALANAVVKKAKNSEKAYICLKMAWLFRGKAETLPKETPDRENVLKELQKEEKELLVNAYEGFQAAFSKESFPMCGMDEITVTYLLADLARRIGHYEESSRWISRVLTSRAANERIKNKARDIKELLNAERNDTAHLIFTVWDWAFDTLICIGNKLFPIHFVISLPENLWISMSVQLFFGQAVCLCYTSWESIFGIFPGCVCISIIKFICKPF